MLFFWQLSQALGALGLVLSQGYDCWFYFSLELRCILVQRISAWFERGDLRLSQIDVGKPFTVCRTHFQTFGYR